MLMVTTTVGMLNGIHSNTTNLGPAVSLGLVLVVGSTSLQHGFVNPSSTGNNSNHGAVSGGDDFLTSGRQLHSGTLCVRVVSDDSCVVTGGSGHLATVSTLLLKIADNGTLGHISNRHHVADSELGFLATVDELAGVHALGSHQQFLPDLISVGVPEVGDSQGCTTTRIVDNIFDYTLDVTMSLSVVDSSERGFPLAVFRVGDED